MARKRTDTYSINDLPFPPLEVFTVPLSFLISCLSLVSLSGSISVSQKALNMVFKVGLFRPPRKLRAFKEPADTCDPFAQPARRPCTYQASEHIKSVSMVVLFMVTRGLTLACVSYGITRNVRTVTECTRKEYIIDL